MSKKLRIISINFSFRDVDVFNSPLDGDRALFDSDVVVIRPPQFVGARGMKTCEHLRSVMQTKRRELRTLFQQGGVVVVVLDVPDVYKVEVRGYGSSSCILDNYDFIDSNFAGCLSKGSGTQITYGTSDEPFVTVLKRSDVAWTSYVQSRPHPPLDRLSFFAYAGKGGAVAGKMIYGEGHLIILPNLRHLDEPSFFDACAEYRFKRQGAVPPSWTASIVVPGLPPIQSAIEKLDQEILNLQKMRQLRETELDEKVAYRKLLYEKGKAQLEPIVLRALDDLDFGTSPGEIIAGTIHEIDGRTSKGSVRGIIEVKGSKNQITQSEFSPFVTKIMADAEIKGDYGKGILVGNGLCETEPGKRAGDSVFSKHVLEGAKRHSIALVNSVELYWLCCALLRGDAVDKNAVREAVLAQNGYVDLKRFSGESPF